MILSKFSKNIETKTPDFSNQPGLNSPRMEMQGIRQKFKTGSFTIGSSDDKDIDVGFSPKALWVKGTSGSSVSDGFTDFTNGFCTREAESLGSTTASTQTNLINVGGTVADVSKRLNKGFRIDVSSYSSSVSCIYMAIG